jgi:hypothetical protein
MTNRRARMTAGLALMVACAGFAPVQKPAAQKPFAASVVVYKSPT